MSKIKSKRNYKQKIKITKIQLNPLWFLLLLGLLTIALVPRGTRNESHLKETKQINSITPTRMLTYDERREKFDMQKLLHGSYKRYENKEINISLDYPPEIKPQYLTEEQANEVFSSFQDKNYNIPVSGGVIFTFSPQPPGAYEMYDGFVTKLRYYQVNPQFNIQQFANNYASGYDEGGFGVKFDGVYKLNNLSGWKYTECCRGIGNVYIFPIRSVNNYIMIIETSSEGQDRDKFNEVVLRMVHTMKAI